MEDASKRCASKVGGCAPSEWVSRCEQGFWGAADQLCRASCWLSPCGGAADWVSNFRSAPSDVRQAGPHVGVSVACSQLCQRGERCRCVSIGIPGCARPPGRHPSLRPSSSTACFAAGRAAATPSHSHVCSALALRHQRWCWRLTCQRQHACQPLCRGSVNACNRMHKAPASAMQSVVQCGAAAQASGAQHAGKNPF